MEEAELTETPDAEVTEEREEWTIERACSETTGERLEEDTNHGSEDRAGLFKTYPKIQNVRRTSSPNPEALNPIQQD